MTAPLYAVGIDLGTTHCAVASARLAKPSVRAMEIPQLVAPGEVAARVLLPSFLYLPAPGELQGSDRTLPWGEAETVVGELARRLGAKVPGRLVTSAKSWVCHGGVNRRAPILPWNAPDDEPHVSPYAAQVAYLQHVRAAWEAHHGSALQEQDVVVTVPASFDEGARELTTAAAAEAGLGEVRLLEEPQAAFYDWLGAHEGRVAQQLGDARLVLVIDVGGGTTDLTLLRVRPDHESTSSEPKIERIAVGGHLMLGGDNMDAALAIFALQKAGIERPEDATVWSALVQSARQAKERLLAADAPASAVISMQSRGSRLVGGTRSITIEREEATGVLLDGFLPHSGPADTAQRTGRAGLTTLGLPYTSDPAIGRHVCTFLRRHAQAAADAGARVIDGLPRPDLVLLNGGVFNAPAMIDRLVDVLAGWYGGPVGLLEHTSLDIAVAHGAVRSALARRGLGEVIGGGTARAYYIGVEAEGGRRALCVAPRAMDEGTSVSVPDRVFDLVLDAPVTFPLLAYTGDRVDAPGAIVEVDPGDESIEPLPPLQTVLRDEASGTVVGARTVPVTLTAALTDTGALELYLVTVALPPRKWRLDFTLHRPVEPQATDADPAAGKRSGSPHAVVAPRFSEARGIVQRAFGERDAKAIKGVRSDLEKVIGPRGQWSAATCRALWDACMEVAGTRGTSDLHELNWLRLVGWSLRPGFGAEGDDARLDAMWSIRGEGLQQRSKANWAEWWITWRRIAAGLDADRQRALFDDVQPWLWRDPSAKPPPGPHRHGPVEMMQLLGVLERLPPSTKREIGELFFDRADKLGSYWPLGRVGARAPFHGDPADVVPPDVAEAWLSRLLELEWAKAEGAAFAAASIGRITADPARDIDPALRTRVAERLAKSGAPASWIDMLTRATDLSEGDMGRIFGDSLPVGLRLT